MGQPPKEYTGPSQFEVLIEIAPFIVAYVDWYCENGFYLPEEFAKDPAGWAQILRDIQAAMHLIIAGADETMLPENKLLYNGLEHYYQYSKHLFKP